MSTKRSTTTAAPVIPDLAQLSLRSVFRGASARPKVTAPSASAVSFAPAASSATSASGGRGDACVALSPGNASAPSAAPQQEVTSVLRFDASHPEVRAYAQARGWFRPDRTVSLLKAELTFTTDGWTTVRTAPLETLAGGGEGFHLSGVAPGTELQFAIRAELGLSATGAEPYEDRAEGWLNNGGANYRARAEEPGARP